MSLQVLTCNGESILRTTQDKRTQSRMVLTLVCTVGKRNEEGIKTSAYFIDHLDWPTFSSHGTAERCPDGELLLVFCIIIMASGSIQSSWSRRFSTLLLLIIMNKARFQMRVIKMLITRQDPLGLLGRNIQYSDVGGNALPTHPRIRTYIHFYYF